MKATYMDFIKNNKNCSKYKKNADAIKVFDFLSEDQNIIEMISASEHGHPALSACVIQLEDFIKKNNLSSMDLNNAFTRAVVGKMVKIILAPFGYIPTKKNNLSQKVASTFFKSASCYEKKGVATMRVVKSIEKL